MKASVCLLLLHCFVGVRCGVNFVPATSTCSNRTETSCKAVYCCGGMCYDGTSISDPSGLCGSFTDMCNDCSPSPSCPGGHQVLFQDNFPNGVDAGYGGCENGDQCKWVRNVANWRCCDCPPNYVSEYNGACSNEPNGPRCVGCDGPGEVLTGDSSTGFQCEVPPPGGNCTMSAAGLQLTKDGEGGFCPDYYNIAGHKTIGYGHDCCEKKDCAKLNPPLTKPQGEELLRKDIKAAVRCVSRLPNIDQANINQFSALVDFVFSAGCGTDTNGKGVRGHFIQQLKSSDFPSICSALPSTATKPASVAKGLRKRRAAEAKLFCAPTDTPSGCPAGSSVPRNEIAEELVVRWGFLEDFYLLNRDSTPAQCTAKAWKGGSDPCHG